MIKIAICDVCAMDREIIQKTIFRIEEKWRSEFKIYSFDSGKKLYESLEENTYDVFFLDIIMEDMDGIETAKAIRRKKLDAKIIFISNDDGRIRELFGIGTIAFIDKPVDEEKLESELKKIYQEMLEYKEKIFCYKLNKIQQFIPNKEIIYFESEGHQVIMHTLGSTVRLNNVLKRVWDQIKTTGDFIMPHKSYIVNLKFANFKNQSLIRVEENGIIIPIGRNYKKDTIFRYMEYLRRKINP